MQLTLKCFQNVKPSMEIPVGNRYFMVLIPFRLFLSRCEPGLLQILTRGWLSGTAAAATIERTLNRATPNCIIWGFVVHFITDIQNPLKWLLGIEQNQEH